MMMGREYVQLGSCSRNVKRGSAFILLVRCLRALCFINISNYLIFQGFGFWFMKEGLSFFLVITALGKQDIIEYLIVEKC
jgi:hypothetical protein